MNERSNTEQADDLAETAAYLRALVAAEIEARGLEQLVTIYRNGPSWVNVRPVVHRRHPVTKAELVTWGNIKRSGKRWAVTGTRARSPRKVDTLSRAVDIALAQLDIKTAREAVDREGVRR